MKSWTMKMSFVNKLVVGAGAVMALSCAVEPDSAGEKSRLPERMPNVTEGYACLGDENSVASCIADGSKLFAKFDSNVSPPSIALLLSSDVFLASDRSTVSGAHFDFRIGYGDGSYTNCGLPGNTDAQFDEYKRELASSLGAALGVVDGDVSVFSVEASGANPPHNFHVNYTTSNSQEFCWVQFRVSIPVMSAESILALYAESATVVVDSDVEGAFLGAEPGLQRVSIPAVYAVLGDLGIEDGYRFRLRNQMRLNTGNEHALALVFPAPEFLTPEGEPMRARFGLIAYANQYTTDP